MCPSSVSSLTAPLLLISQGLFKETAGRHWLCAAPPPHPHPPSIRCHSSSRNHQTVFPVVLQLVTYTDPSNKVKANNPDTCARLPGQDNPYQRIWKEKATLLRNVVSSQGQWRHQLHALTWRLHIFQTEVSAPEECPGSGSFPAGSSVAVCSCEALQQEERTLPRG